MTDELATDGRGEREQRIARILDLALLLVEERLDCVDAKEKKDNMAFDRVARTAQSFIRVALDADALAARKRKEAAAHDEGAHVRLPDDKEIDVLERALRRRMARSDRDAQFEPAQADGHEPQGATRIPAGGIA